MEDQQKAAYASLANFSKSGEQKKMTTKKEKLNSLGNYLLGYEDKNQYIRQENFLREFEIDDRSLKNKLKYIKNSKRFYSILKVCSTMMTGTALASYAILDDHILKTSAVIGFSECTRYIMNRLKNQEFNCFNKNDIN